jgi:hypothetical protein
MSKVYYSSLYSERLDELYGKFVLDPDLTYQQWQEVSAEDCDDIDEALWHLHEFKKATLARMPYSEYLKTDHWKNIREQMLAGHPACALCDKPSDLQVHHKTYARRGHETPYDLIVLCRNCHAKHHDKIP